MKSLSAMSCQVTVLGYGNVGKTSLLKVVSGLLFDEQEDMTKGYRIFNIQKELLYMEIRDMGGQNHMHSAHRCFLASNNIFVIVHDSVQDEFGLEYWLKIIRSYDENAPIIVVCNKSDIKNADLNWTGLKNKYPSIYGFIKKLSCKTKFGVNEFKEMLFKVAKEITIKKPISIEESSREILQRLKKTYMDFYRDQDPDQHFPNYPNMLKWIMNGTYLILNSKITAEQKGILSQEQLKQILLENDSMDPSNQYPERTHQFLIRMMCSLYLAFQLEADTYISSRLVKQMPDNENFKDLSIENPLELQYRYDGALPELIMETFITMMFTHAIKKVLIWKNGIVINDNQSHAYIWADITDSVIYIRICGKEHGKKAKLKIIREVFDKINSTLTEAKNSLKLVIPDVGGKALVSIDHLIALIEKGIDKYIFEGIEHVVSVKDLYDLVF